MVISREYRSPHFEGKKSIPVEFVVLHYTAQSLKESLRIFLDTGSKPVSCHLLIDEQGGIYELVDCWNGNCKKAYHAGKSFFRDTKGKKWENFNDFSLGIELVNWNGNIFPFTDSQYKSLFKLLFHLKNIYPALQDPERLIGHEHIAGFRGKKDPGGCFDWQRLLKEVYPRYFESNQSSVSGQDIVFKLKSVLTKKQCQSLDFLNKPKKWNDKKARNISLLMENTFLPFWLKKILFWLETNWIKEGEGIY